MPPTYRAGPQRPALAGALVEASTLAGSQALDRAAVGQCGRTTNAPSTLAKPTHSPCSPTPTAEQVFVLIDLDETTAAAGHADDAPRAFDTASDLLPADPVDPTLPFLFLGDSHLDRWRGNALDHVGAPAAINQLAAALACLPADFVRARTNLLVDLAYAHAAAGDCEAALTLRATGPSPH